LLRTYTKTMRTCHLFSRDRSMTGGGPGNAANLTDTDESIISTFANSPGFRGLGVIGGESPPIFSN